ncbi:MAG TPA: hypothetical protein VKM94_18385 [Blastocatellia bacterium]|nr:hypothetical protein [Blastocatellia bacterium]
MIVTAFASNDRVRFAAPSSIVQIRLEVYGSTGKKVFDNEVRGGNVLDWQLQDGQAERLPDDTYLCVVTVKSLSGRITERMGSVMVENTSASVQPVDASQMTPQQSQAIGPVEENASLTVLKEGETQTGTVIAHDGTDGQLIRRRGALSFRIGDFFSGKDTEQMRLTEEGNLGIGISHPQLRLDVDGMIRASKGILFPDGTIQTTAALDGRVSESAEVGKHQNNLGNLQGSANQNVGKGKVGKKGIVSPDLFVNEDLTVNGNIIFTPPPLSTPQRDITIQNNTGGLRFFGAPTLTASPAAAAIQFWGNASLFPGQLYLDSGAHNSGAVIIRTAGTGGTITERMRVTANGNVGIGTTNPLSTLSVTGTGFFSTGVQAGTPSQGANFLQSVPSGWRDSYVIFRGGSQVASVGIDSGGNKLQFFTGSSSDDSTARVTIDSSGNVGIGTPAPTARLAVRGDGTDVLIGSAGCASPTAGIGFGAMSGCNNFALGGDVSNTSNAGIYINRPTGQSLHFREGNGPDQMIIAPGRGNVGIGTTSPQARLHAVTGQGVGVKGEADFLADVESIGGQFKNPSNTAAIAIRADGNAVQTLQHGGWVKAMAFVTGDGTVVRCYNSQATGFTRSLAPCGISVTLGSLGAYTIGFPFRVDDRFISVTSLNTHPVSQFALLPGFVGSNTVSLFNYQTSSGDPVAFSFYIFVY